MTEREHDAQLLASISRLIAHTAYWQGGSVRLSGLDAPRRLRPLIPPST